MSDAPTRPVLRYHGPFRMRYVVDAATGCHVWQGATSQGYGIVGTNRRGTFKAHRIAYEAARGPIPAGLQLDHLCRNRACINPAHLEPVTNAENARRGARARLTPDDVREIRRLYAAGGVSTRALGRRFGVSGCAIVNVIHRKRWKEVSNE